MDVSKLSKIARKQAVKNAFDYGRAQAAPILSKVLAELPEAKTDLDQTRLVINKVLSEVNALSKEELASELASYSFPVKVQREGLPELPWVVEGEPVITRFAPNPSGFLHVGHSKVAILCDEYSKKYGGKFWVRFDDTDPKTKKPMPEAYQLIIEDLKWLGCSIAGVIKQSERLPLYYSYAERLLRDGSAYVCTCEKEKMRENRRAGKPCKCRNSGGLAEWKKMFKEYGEGEAVLRLKTDLKHPNSSVRDWVMFRIIDEPHPMTGSKYRVWPLYNFASAVDDHEMGINLVIRGKEHELNFMKQQCLYEVFSWTLPHILVVGILKVKGELAHKSDILNAIKSGKLSGWDDPRAPTLMGMRKRGVNPKALRQYIISSGTGKADSFFDALKLASIEKKLASANR
jgi:glutamyl-tRNA synthetase